MDSSRASLFPLDRVRARFPSLSVRDEGRRRVYTDNPAGTQVPDAVIEAVSGCFARSNSNMGGFFVTTRAVDATLEAAHAAAADFLGASDAGEIAVGPSMSALTFQVSRALGRRFAEGDEIILSRMDHEANVSPWLRLAEDRGLVIKWLDFDRESWSLRPEDFARLLTPRTKLAALNHASNMLGSVNPVRELCALARKAGVLTYIDSVQAAPHLPVDVAETGCDFLVCSAYKFFGPHLGILWGRREILESLDAYRLRCGPSGPASRFETGTPQVELQAGLAACIDYWAWLGGETGTRRARILAGYEGAQRHENALGKRLIEGLLGLPGVTIHGITAPDQLHRRVPTVVFNHARKTPSSIAAALAAENIFVWNGHNYAFELAPRLGLDMEEGALRIGLAHYNSAEEVEEILEALERVLR
jgi:cysteine desulfurase family protein (TIGR01976 family)